MVCATFCCFFSLPVFAQFAFAVQRAKLGKSKGCPTSLDKTAKRIHLYDFPLVLGRCDFKVSVRETFHYLPNAPYENVPDFQICDSIFAFAQEESAKTNGAY